MGLKPRGGWVTQKAGLTLLEFLGYGRPEFVTAKNRTGTSCCVENRGWPVRC